MKTNKTYYPIVAASCLAFGALIPVSLGGEKKQEDQVVATQVAEADTLVDALKAKIITPLTKQAELRGKFSRMGPTHSTSYQLVENTKKAAGGQRSFSVMRKQTPLRKSAKESSSEYLKLRYVEKGDQVLVNLKDAWVELDEHPIIKMLPKAKPATDIRP